MEEEGEGAVAASSPPSGRAPNLPAQWLQRHGPACSTQVSRAWLRFLRNPPRSSVDPERSNLSSSRIVTPILSFKNHVHNRYCTLSYLIFHKLDYDFFLNDFIFKRKHYVFP